MHPFVHYPVQLKGVGKFFICRCGIFLPDVLQHVEDLRDGHIIGESPDLWHVAYFGTVSPLASNIVAIKGDMPAIGHHHAEQAFYKCGLSAAVWSDEGNGLPFPADKVDIIKGL